MLGGSSSGGRDFSPPAAEHARPNSEQSYWDAKTSQIVSQTPHRQRRSRYCMSLT